MQQTAHEAPKTALFQAETSPRAIPVRIRLLPIGEFIDRR